MLAQKFQKWLLVFIPAETIFRVTHLEAIKVQFSKEPLVPVAIRVAEDVGGTIAFIASSLNDTAPPEQGETSFCDAGRLSECGEPTHRKTIAEIKFNRLSPNSVRP